MFIPEQKTLFISQLDSNLETIYLVDDADVVSFLKYYRRISDSSSRLLWKNVLPLLLSTFTVDDSITNLFIATQICK